MNKELVIGIASGFLAGAALGYFATKRLVESKTEEYINDEMEKVRKDYARYYAGEDPAKQALKEKYEAERGEVKIRPTEASIALAKVVKAEAEEILEEMKYVRPAEPVEDVVSVFDVHQEWQDLLASQDREEARAFLIDVEEFMTDDPTLEEICVTYFEGDGVMTEAKDDGIVDIETTVTQELLEHFGVNRRDKETLHIVNLDLGTKFEVSRDNRTYTKAVLGIADEVEPPRKKRREADE